MNVQWTSAAPPVGHEQLEHGDFRRHPMRGYSHALTGAAAWGSAVHIASWSFDTTVDPILVASGMVLTAGHALLPDADHHSGTIAYSLPGVTLGSWTLIPSPTALMCRAVGSLSGGHRHATHSWVGIAVCTVLAWLLSLVHVTDALGTTRHYGSGLLALLAIAFAVKALGWSREAAGVVGGRSIGATMLRGFLRSSVAPWAFALAGAGIPTWRGYEWPWMWAMVALGCFIHIAGDTMTTGGAPWLWPINPKPPKSIGPLGALWYRNGYFAVAVLGNTTSRREVAFAVLVAVYVAALFLYAFAQFADLAILA